MNSVVDPTEVHGRSIFQYGGDLGIHCVCVISRKLLTRSERGPQCPRKTV